jgi:hypothetical protein
MHAMGCLVAMFAGLFPRLGLLIVWICRPNLVDNAFSTWILPVIGIVFLPFATLMYVILYTANRGLTGGEWFWVAVAALLDVAHWGSGFRRRRRAVDTAAV